MDTFSIIILIMSIIAFLLSIINIILIKTRKTHVYNGGL